MSKEIGYVQALTSEAYNRQDGSLGYRVTALTEEGSACVFYRDGSEGEPKKGDKYRMILGFDRSLKPVVRMERA